MTKDVTHSEGSSVAARIAEALAKAGITSNVPESQQQPAHRRIPFVQYLSWLSRLEGVA